MTDGTNTSESERVAYVKLLICHDWSYEYSDDGRVWARGGAERAKLEELAHVLDPDFTIWNTHAPSDYQR